MKPLRTLLAQRKTTDKEDLLPSGIPQEELSRERQEEMFEFLARKIVDFRVEAPATFFLGPHKPVSTILSYFALLSGIPLMMEIFHILGYEWTTFFGRKENTEQLMKRTENYRRSQERRLVKPGEVLGI